MVEFLRTFSDDQLAIMGCALAFVMAGLVTQLTYSFGPSGRTSAIENQVENQPGLTPSLPIPAREVHERAA